jgi:hypothetical protein
VQTLSGGEARFRHISDGDRCANGVDFRLLHGICVTGATPTGKRLPAAGPWRRSADIVEMPSGRDGGSASALVLVGPSSPTPGRPGRFLLPAPLAPPAHPLG